MASASAAPYGKSLSQREMENLFDSLFACKEPNYSAFSKKTVISIVTIDEIDNRFWFFTSLRACEATAVMQRTSSTKLIRKNKRHGMLSLSKHPPPNPLRSRAVKFYNPDRDLISVEKCTPPNLACRRYATTLWYTSYIPDGMLGVMVSSFFYQSIFPDGNEKWNKKRELNSPALRMGIKPISSFFVINH